MENTEKVKIDHVARTSEKLEAHRKKLASLQLKKQNIEREILNLETKIRNQEDYLKKVNKSEQS